MEIGPRNGLLIQRFLDVCQQLEKTGDVSKYADSNWLSAKIKKNIWNDYVFYDEWNSKKNLILLINDEHKFTWRLEIDRKWPYIPSWW